MNSIPIDQLLSGSQDFFSGISWLFVHAIKVERSFYLVNNYLKKILKKRPVDDNERAPGINRTAAESVRCLLTLTACFGKALLKAISTVLQDCLHKHLLLVQV